MINNSNTPFDLNDESLIRIVPDVRTESHYFRERDSNFTAPLNTVITGRNHQGDENGNTSYEYATLKAIDSNGDVVAGVISVVNNSWGSSQKESASNYTAGTNGVITGRKHQGDENGLTEYMTSIILFNGTPCQVLTSDPYSGSEIVVRESEGTWVKADGERVLVGRKHDGDENGRTIYSFGLIVFKK